MNQRIRGTIFVMLSAVGFGIMPFLAVRVYDYGGNAIFLTFCRFLLSLPLLWLLARRSGDTEKQPVTLPFWGIMIAFSLTPLLMFLSYTFIASSLTTTIHFLYPALVLLLCRVLFQQKIPLVKYGCCLVCIVGVALFCVSGGEIHMGGVILAFASAVTYAIYTACLPASGLQQKLSAYRLTFRLNLCGACIMAIFNTCMGTWAFDMAPMGWVYTLALSWLTAVGSAVLFQLGVKLCGSQNTAMFSTLEPVTSVVMGAVFLHEDFTVQTAIGVVLILAAVFVLSVYGHKPKKA